MSTESTESNKTPRNGGASLTRRDALARLGIAATAVYAAPTLLQLKSASAAHETGGRGGVGHGTGHGGGHGGHKGIGEGRGGGGGTGAPSP